MNVGVTVLASKIEFVFIWRMGTPHHAELQHDIAPPLRLEDAVARALPRVGIIVPASNTTCETELNRLAQGMYSLHASRMDVVAGGAVGDVDAFYAAALEMPIRHLAASGADIAVLACTNAAMALSPEQLRRSFHAWAPHRLAHMSDAIVAALRDVGAERVALFTPYVAQSNAMIATFLLDHGIGTIRSFGLGLNTTPRVFASVSRLSRHFLRESVMQMDRSGADCLFLSCTDLPTLDLIDELEHDLRIPVVSSNLALFRSIRKALEAAAAAADVSWRSQVDGPA